MSAAAAIERECLQYDVVIVGAGPAGLACAIRLKQLKPAASVCVLEKGSAVGAHSLSGAVLEPGPLEQLLPEWSGEYTGMKVPAAEDDFRIFTRRGSFKPVPDWLIRLLPRSMTYSTPFNNHGNYIVSLGQLTAWLASKAESLGVEVFPGFAAAAPLYETGGAVRGVQIGDMGLDRTGAPGPNFTAGVEIHAPLTVLAEGARGSIAKQLITRFGLTRGHCPQTFALGYKELWQLPPGRVRPGRIEHGLGWPADPHTYAGSFLYHLDNDRVYVGYIVGLDYRDPRLAPFEAFQQYKNHPQVKPLLEGGEIVSAGARVIVAGGWQSTPTLEMPGAILIGDAGGTLNFAKIKGVHQAIRSGALAAEHIAASGGGAGFDARWRASQGGRELQRVRNFKPAFKRGMWVGLVNSAWELLTAGHSPWTLKNSADWSRLSKLDEFDSPDRGWAERTLPPRDRVSFVFFAGNAHEESQPVHLKVADTRICIERCSHEFGNPCERFCPAGVYEIVDDGSGGRRLQINAANCVHCKACDIKDPYEIITWTTPEGGSGPNYQSL
ncbi:MAG TPA: electron transfer flavoprotein-ubiquinone oxidoreductase [Steroidobacteraceae bacterium]|jgi:electron-transferring-flavoprotein dehydrogenase|nr:electron transfer flavoprotein-ubiquinone oxidoreductase [Steroidobacteraceae bacterium]